MQNKAADRLPTAPATVSEPLCVDRLPHGRPHQRLVANDQTRTFHAPATTVREHLARQPDRELAEFADLAFHGDRSAMLLRHNVIGDRQTEAGALAGWLAVAPEAPTLKS